MKWGMLDMMRSRYFFNNSIIRQNFRQHGWIGIIYTLGLLFALPLQLFMSNDPNPNAKPQEVDNLFRIAGNVQVLFIISIPVVAGLFLFRYLQAKSPSDLWHSLPLRREHLLTANLTSGLLLLLLPVWLTTAVVAAVKPLVTDLFIFQGAEIWNWCITVSVLTLFLFCFSVFIGICMGQTILQGIVVYILLILPAVLISLIDSHLSMYLYGYPNLYASGFNAEKWSPFIHLIYYASTKPFTSVELWIYGALSAIFIGLCYLLYRKRHTEKAGQAIAFVYFNPLFKAGVMFCAMLVSGSYFTQMKQQQMGWVISGYAIGAIIGYIAAEMIIRKTWQIMTRKVPTEFAIYAVLLGILLYIPSSGLTGYEARVPSGDKISGVYVGNHYVMYYREVESYGVTPFTGEDPFSSDKNYIEAVRKLHQAVVTMRPEPSSILDYESFTLAYQMDDGRKLLRDYWVPRKGFEAELKAVKEAEGYKRAENQLSLLDKELDVMWITNRNKRVGVTDPMEISELKEILKREYLNMSYEDQIDYKPAVAYVEVDVKVNLDSDRPYSSYGKTYPWRSSFHELEEWMNTKGYADKVRITAEDVKSVEIVKDDLKDDLNLKKFYDPAQRVALARQNNRTVVTKDKALLTDILDHRFVYGVENGNYIVKLDYKEDYTDYMMLKESDLTPGLKALLK